MTNKTDRNKPSPTACGLLFDPEKIPYYGKLPADFMQFWMDGRKEIADRPLELTPISVSDPNVEAWRVKVDSVNGPVYGFLAKPKKPGKYPASVMVPGAGPGFVGPDLDFARKGYISLLMNVHEYEVPQDAKKAREIYQEQARKFYYPAKNAQDRDLYFFRRVILGVDRAINYVAAMPEYNGKNFLMYGSSQGGAMTLALTGLNKNITACAANVPAMCDHFGQDNVRPSGWPRITRQFKTPEEQSIVLQNMAYYDAANFATFITVPTFVSCGLIDGTCSPSSVYSAYNRLNTKQKDMFIMPGLGHVHTRDYIQKRDAWFEKYTR